MLQIFPRRTTCGKSLKRQKPKSEAIVHLRSKLVEAKHKFSQNMNIRLTPCHLWHQNSQKATGQEKGKREFREYSDYFVFAVYPDAKVGFNASG